MTVLFAYPLFIMVLIVNELQKKIARKLQCQLEQKLILKCASDFKGLSYVLNVI